MRSSGFAVPSQICKHFTEYCTVLSSHGKPKKLFCFVLLEGVSVFGQRGDILIFVDLKVIAMARNIYLRSVVMHHKS
jgi:hypothetical protein